MSARRILRVGKLILFGALLVAGIGCSDDPEGGPDAAGDGGVTDASDEDTNGVDPFDSGDEDTSGQDDDTSDKQDSGGDQDSSTNMDSNGGDDADGGQCDNGVTGGGGGSCDFFPDNCPCMEKCFYTGGGSTMCAQYDSSKSVGDSCNPQNSDFCNHGQTCFQGECRPTCDHNNTAQYGCPTDQSCVGPLQDQNGNTLPYGVCQDSCTYWPNDSCTATAEKCAPSNNGPACLQHGTKAADESCQGIPQCGKKLVCLGGTCRTMCEDGSRCDSGETCQQTQFNFKVCNSS